MDATTKTRIEKILIEKTDKAVKNGSLTIAELKKQAADHPGCFADFYLKIAESEKIYSTCKIEELMGADWSWEDISNDYQKMNESEILNDLNEIFAQDDNTALAASIAHHIAKA